jgi:tetratricopeptide (TPR) repeat protein
MALFLRTSTLEVLAQLIELRGRPNEALALRREALTLAEASLGPQMVASHAFGLAQSLLANGPSREATVLLERAVVVWRGHGRDEWGLAYALLAEAQLAFAAGDLEQAERHAWDASRMLASSEFPPGLANASMLAGVLAHQRGEYMVALEAFDRAIELLEEDMVPRDLTIMLLQANAGASLLAMRHWDEARARFETSLRSKRPGPHESIALQGLATLDLRYGESTAVQRRLDAPRGLDGEIEGDDRREPRSVESEHVPMPALIYVLY